MSKITPDHLNRQAFVYVRQSTRDQLRQHHESRRRQYGLADRARKLGWSEPVIMVDDDLGRSGGGTARPGFERLLAAICEGRVGIVLAVEASRLARNGRDWHTLLEFCGLVNCLLADDQAIYDPRLPNDRLLLGMQGSMSELELSLLRQRSFEALRQKAQRGELFLNVAVGYVKVRHDRIAKDPDRRVQEAIGLVFRKFAALQSIRQVHLWLRQEEVRLPAVEDIGEGRRVVWKLPVYSTIHKLLTNPVYGGAYAFGRTGSRITVENGRKRVRRGLYRDREQWDVLIVDHHEGYVSWAEYERNQRVIADNATRVGAVARGAVRRGDGLLAGLLRCGHCGRRLHVSYNGKQGVCVRYSCRGAHLNHGTRACIAFGGVRVDAAVATEVLRLLQPLGIEAALEAVAMREQEHAETRRQAELALTQARYEADLARRQYDAVDPANRLVAGELECRWNARLADVQQQEEKLEGLTAARPEALSEAEHERLRAHSRFPGAVCRQRWTVRLGEVEPVFGQTGRVVLDITARTAHDGALKWTRAPSTPRAARSILATFPSTCALPSGGRWSLRRVLQRPRRQRKRSSAKSSCGPSRTSSSAPSSPPCCNARCAPPRLATRRAPSCATCPGGCGATAWRPSTFAPPGARRCRSRRRTTARNTPVGRSGGRDSTP